MSPCPDDNEVARALGARNGPAFAALETHLESCESCRLAVLAYGDALPAAEEPEAADGPVHEGRFELVRLLGRGGFSLVWEALDLATGHSVALKIVEDQLGAAAARRAVREARGLCEMECPYILKARESFRTIDGRIAIVTDLLRGEDLGHTIQRQGALPEAEVRRLLRDTARGLAYAHERGVVHRDLKPRNVFLEAPGERVRILDFGMARWLDVLGISSKLTATGTILGTPSYMSPEQISGETDLSSATDIWSLAVLAIECASGKSPIEARSFGRIFRIVTTGAFPRLREAAPHVSHELADLVDAMSSAHPSERPTAQTLVTALA